MKVLTENTAEKKEENAVTELLNAYLEKAVAVSACHKRTDANGLIRECYERLIKEGVGEEDLLKAAGEKEKALKEQASKFSLQAKLNYLTNADRKKEEIKGENIVFNGMGGAFIGVAVTMGTMMASMAGNQAANGFVSAGLSSLGSTIMGPAVAAMAAYVGVKTLKNVPKVLLKSKNAEEKKTADEYADIKHAQFALKVLRKAILHPVLDTIPATITKALANKTLSSQEDSSDNHDFSNAARTAAMNANTAVMSANTAARCAMMATRIRIR